MILSWKADNSFESPISWVENRNMPPPIIKITVKMERKAANILFIPHDSNFFVKGNSIKDINKAKPKGIRIGLAKIKMAKSANTVART
jgi:hypothetical protein